MVKMESTEEDEDRLTTSSPEQPRPSTSKAVSPPHLDGPSNPESPILEEETLLLTSNHVTSDTRETGREINEAGPWVGPYAVLRYLESPPPQPDPTWALKATRIPTHTLL